MYNEEANVRPLCAALRDALADWPRRYEVLLVDDGSSDGTAELIRDEASRDPRLRHVRFLRNAGQTRAMATGFAEARAPVIVSMDGDLQNDPLDIPLVVSRIEAGFDVVCGWRKARQDKWLSRKLPSRIANRMIAFVTGIPIHDNGCSLKAYRASVIQSVRLYSDMHRFLPALSSMTGARIDEVVVRHHARVHGKSKYGISRTFKVLGDILVIKMLTRFANRPGLWFAGWALPFFVLSAVAAGLWLDGVWHHSQRSIIYPGLSVLFVYIFGHLMGLSVLSELLLAKADRRGLRRLATVLAASEEWIVSDARTSGAAGSSHTDSQEGLR